MADKYAAAVLKFGKNVITNKQSRSAFFLIVSLIAVLGLNSLLPVIEGDTHYTHASIEVTYGEYKHMHTEDRHIRLTWVSQQTIKTYVKDYIKKHVELTPEEALLVEPPDALTVLVYTKFFFEHTFWWIATAVSFASTLIVFYSLFNYLNVKNKSKYLKYINLVYQMDQLVEQYIDPDTFEPWMIEDFNRTRKINQHTANIKYSIDRLERRTDHKIKHEVKEHIRRTEEYAEQNKSWLSSEFTSDNVPIPPQQLSKKAKKYLDKREHLRSFLEDSYIKELVIDGRVKHFVYIHPMFVYGGINDTGIVTDNYSQIMTDAKQLRKDAMSKIVLTLVLIFVFAVLFTITVIASVEQSTFWMVVNIISKLVPLLLQVPFAYDYRDSFMEKHLLKNIYSRRTIGLMYLADMKKRGNNKDNISIEVISLAEGGGLDEQPT